MSVIAHSPYSGVKRLFEDDSSEPFDTCEKQQRVGVKRVRYTHSPSGRRFHPSDRAYAPALSSVVALRAIFPDMDEQTVATVLVECGDNIDAAIKRLGELRLISVENTSASATEQPQQPAAEQSVRDGPSTSSPTGVTAEANQPAAQGPQTPEQWIESLVQEMHAASSLDNARQRAGAVLHAFEQFTLGRAQQQTANSEAHLKSRVDEVLKENQILKRAVQIQNSRMQEAALKEQEIQHLKELLAQHQEQVRTLQISNYSLALHLQQATTSGSSASHSRNPDVF